jgi:sRNA-binding carbon storage regulator CsrA
MLVLSRKVGERILVPDLNVVLTVVSVKRIAAQLRARNGAVAGMDETNDP